MRPAFSSTRQAARFTLLLLVLLASPLLAGRWLLPSREAGYAAEGWLFGPYPWVQKQIFQETNDIDIAFIGSSKLMWGIDTPYVQQQLDARLGRPSVVRSLCWFQSGYDAMYFAAQDLLAHRKVHLLVFTDEQPKGHFHVHTRAYRFFTMANLPDIAGLPASIQFTYYADAILGLPRNIWSRFSPAGAVFFKPPAADFYQVEYSAPNPFSHLGSISAASTEIPGVAFQPFHPTPLATPAEVLCFDAQNRTNFVFSAEGIHPAQLYFLRKMTALARENGVRLAVLHTPDTNELNAATIPERMCWPDLLGPDVQLLGLPGARLFAGLTDAEKLRLFYDDVHFNQNGQQFYTPIITPALIQLYENQINP